MQKDSVRIRVPPALAALITIGLGLFMRASTTGFLAKYSGTALWAVLVYWIVVFVRPNIRISSAFLLTTAISFIVEFSQLTPGPMALYNIHPAFALVFGTTYSTAELPAYAAGALVASGIHAAIRKVRKIRIALPS